MTQEEMKRVHYEELAKKEAEELTIKDKQLEAIKDNSRLNQNIINKVIQKIKSIVNNN